MLMAFVREHGPVHPRAVDPHFSHGRVTNYWGGSSNATTHLLDAMHYRGLLRVARREDGIRIYEPREHGQAPPTTRRASRRSTRWSTWRCANTRRCRPPASRRSSAGCVTPCHSGGRE